MGIFRGWEKFGDLKKCRVVDRRIQMIGVFGISDLDWKGFWWTVEGKWGGRRVEGCLWVGVGWVRELEWSEWERELEWSEWERVGWFIAGMNL
jgi:hypothetical protein